MREARAAELGFGSLEDCYMTRYVTDGARLEDLQRELWASYSATPTSMRRGGRREGPEDDELAKQLQVLKRAKRSDLIIANPAEDVDRVSVKASGRYNHLTVEQVEAVARASDAEQDRCLVLVAAFTGLRLGELRALRWQDVDFATRTVHVRRNLPSGAYDADRVPKSGKVRSLPLMDQAAAALDALSRRGELTQPEDRVFVSPTGGPFDDGKARDAFYDALAAAGLGHLRDGETPFVFHELRHTFGTLMVQVFPLVDVQAWMGHADVQTTMRYVHHVPKHNAADRFSAFVATQRAEARVLAAVDQ